MVLAQPQEGFYPLGRNVGLDDVGWRNHVATIGAQDFDFLADIRLQLLVTAVWQQVLLVDGAPENKFVAKPSLSSAGPCPGTPG